MNKTLTLATVALTAFAFSNCKDHSESKTNTGALTEDTAASLVGIFTDSVPAGAVSVGEARKLIGDKAEEIVVEGMLANDGPVFHSKAAMFWICDDSKIQKSGEHAEHGDAGEAAEDFDWCCTEPEVLKEALLPLQVVDANGTPIGATLNGVNNMKENARVVVKGKPAPTSTPQAPLLNVIQIFVVPSNMEAAE